jgi:hypothetical protein
MSAESRVEAYLDEIATTFKITRMRTQGGDRIPLTTVQGCLNLKGFDGYFVVCILARVLPPNFTDTAAFWKREYDVIFS